MKLHLYLKHFSPSGTDLHEGTQKAVHGLASGLVTCGAQVTVVCEGPQESLHHTENGYTIACFTHKNTHPSFALSPGLKEYVCTQPNDSLFILNGIFHRSVFALSQVLKRHSIPYIVAPHDPYHPAIFRKNAHLKVPYWYLLERQMLQQANAIQVLDSRHKEWLRRLKIKTPVMAVPNGFSPKDVLPEAQLEWREQETPKLFFLGRLDSYNKGLDLLLDAFAQVTQITDCHLSLQGPDWGDRQSLEHQAKQLSLPNQVSFLAPDYQTSPAALTARHDIFCIPSRFEGFSLSALEAMLVGRVLLISDVAGIAPHVQACQCGVVVKPEVAAIKAGILELLERRSEWREMGLRGRHYALKHLHWKTISSDALEQYSQLLSNRNATESGCIPVR